MFGECLLYRMTNKEYVKLWNILDRKESYTDTQINSFVTKCAFHFLNSLPFHSIKASLRMTLVIFICILIFIMGCSIPGKPGPWGHRAGHNCATEYPRTVSSTGVPALAAQWQTICMLMEERRVQSWGWEDPMEKEMTTHSSILAWRPAWTEEPGGLQSMELQRVRRNLVMEQ